jgi:ribosomal protein L10
MGLAAMMDLVLEQVREQPVAALGLHAGISVDAHSGAKRLLRQSIADRNQPAIDGALLTQDEIQSLAKLGSMDQVRARLVGLMQAPAQALVRLLNEPGASLARALRVEHAEARLN